MPLYAIKLDALLLLLLPWQVSELVPGGQGSIPALAEALLVVSKALDAEMGLMPSVEVRRVVCHALGRVPAIWVYVCQVRQEPARHRVGWLPSGR